MNKTKKNFLKICIFLLVSTLIISNIPITLSLNSSQNSDILKKGWKETIDGLIVLHINGSNYEMGYQLGYYLKEEYMICHRAWLDYFEDKCDITLEDAIEIWNIMNSSIPQEYKEEMRGRADALGLSFEEVAVMEILGLAIYMPKKCCALAAWGSATKDGKLIHISSGDWKLDLKDPLTGEYLTNNQIMIVRKPDNAYSSVTRGMPTEVGIEGGVNEKGIVVAYTSVPTVECNIMGIPLGLRQLMVMDHAGSIEEAIDILNSNLTVGWSFIVGDSKIPIAYALEQHANYSYTGTWDNPVEGNYHSWNIENMVRRGNIFLDPVLAGVDPNLYNKSTFLRWFIVFASNFFLDFLGNNLPKIKPITNGVKPLWNWFLEKFGIKIEKNYYLEITHFTAVSKTFERHWGKLTLNNSMKYLRCLYKANLCCLLKRQTNLKFFLTRLIYPMYSKTWDQAVICPQTGDMLVSFSHNETSAFNRKVHYFNMYDLLNSQP